MATGGYVSDIQYDFQSDKLESVILTGGKLWRWEDNTLLYFQLIEPLQIYNDTGPFEYYGCCSYKYCNKCHIQYYSSPCACGLCKCYECNVEFGLTREKIGDWHPKKFYKNGVQVENL